MPPDDPAAPPETTVIAAPARAKRLVPVAAVPRPAGASVRPASGLAASIPIPPPARASEIERKVTAAHDPQEVLRLIQTEAALRRAQRLTGGGDRRRQTMRLLSVGMLFALMIAAVGAMWYLQTTLTGGRRHSRPGVPAPPPAAQVSPAGSTRPSPAPAH